VGSAAASVAVMSRRLATRALTSCLVSWVVGLLPSTQPVPVELGERLVESRASGGWLVLIRGGLEAEELIAENAVGPRLELVDRPAAFSASASSASRSYSRRWWAVASWASGRPWGSTWMCAVIGKEK